jgi:hypothetical protein
MTEPVDLHAGQLLGLAQQLRAEMLVHQGKMLAAAAQITAAEKWGARDEFTERFCNGDRGYDAARNRVLGANGSMSGNDSTLGVSFGPNGFAGLLDILETAAITMPDQDGEGGKKIDDAGGVSA